MPVKAPTKPKTEKVPDDQKTEEEKAADAAALAASVQASQADEAEAVMADEVGNLSGVVKDENGRFGVIVSVREIKQYDPATGERTTSNAYTVGWLQTDREYGAEELTSATEPE